MNAAANVLVVDDERNIRRTLRMVLEGEGCEVVEAGTGEDALRRAAETPPDLVLLDVRLPGIDGLTVLERMRDLLPAEVPVVMISGHATVADAVQATKMGAFDFMEKPIERDRLMVTLRNALDRRQLQSQVQELRSKLDASTEMLGESQPMQRLFREIEKVAPTKGRVLITGESGTGKELIARAIHRLSPRARGPFVKVNCAAIPSELIESELFGHEKGSFTGAVGRKRGQFEVADGGTLLLDEIGDMSPSAQAKVLRALQTGEVVRVGSENVLHVDVRVIAATNKDLEKAVKEGAFREDLYFRLNVVPLQAPPLRDRPGDIPILVEAYVDTFCREHGFRRKTVTPEVMQRLEDYPWPGNVRELKNIIERMVIMSDEVIDTEDLPDDLFRQRVQAGLPATTPRTLRQYKEQMERRFILRNLLENDWNISRTAEVLGIERTNLHKKIRQFGLQRDER